MSASQPQRADWLGPVFWEHDSARRSLERVMPREAEDLRRAWLRYCEVIAELDQTTAEFAALRTCVD